MPWWMLAPAIGAIGAAVVGNRTSKSSDQAAAALNADQMAYNERWDINKPWHKLGNAAQEQYYGQIQRTQDMERNYQNKSLADMYNMAKGEGATLQEFLGSPAAGGTGNSGGVSTMGNIASQQNQMAAQTINNQQQRAFIAQQNAADRKTAILQTAMQTGLAGLGSNLTAARGQDIAADTARAGQQTALAQSQISADAQVKSAGISAAASKYASDTQRAINDRQMDFKDREYATIALPAAAAALDISRAELEKKVNEITTSSPEFIERKVMATMSSSNIIATTLAQRYGLNPMNPDISGMSDTELNNLIIDMIALESWSFKESAGAASIIKEGVSDIGNTIGDWFSR